MLFWSKYVPNSIEAGRKLAHFLYFLHGINEERMLCNHTVDLQYLKKKNSYLSSFMLNVLFGN